MKKLILMLPLIASVMMWNGLALAGEHGGKEHGGETHEGSHGMTEDHMATLNEAASALKDSHPDLAKKLEDMAKMKK